MCVGSVTSLHAVLHMIAGRRWLYYLGRLCTRRAYAVGHPYVAMYTVCCTLRICYKGISVYQFLEGTRYTRRLDGENE